MMMGSLERNRSATMRGSVMRTGSVMETGKAIDNDDRRFGED